LALPEFAAIMEARFQPELWRMAKGIAEQQLAREAAKRRGGSTSRLTELNFLARIRKDAEASQPTVERQSAATLIQAARRGLRTRQQTKQLKRALGRMALLGTMPAPAMLVTSAFLSWADNTRRGRLAAARRSSQTVEHSAAVRIQARYRGCSTRRLMRGRASHQGQGDNALRTDLRKQRTGSNGKKQQAARKKFASSSVSSNREQAAAMRIQARARGRSARKLVRTKKKAKQAKKQKQPAATAATTDDDVAAAAAALAATEQAEQERTAQRDAMFAEEDAYFEAKAAERRQQQQQEEEAGSDDDDEGLIEVVCPSCTMINNICNAKCDGCHHSLADAELLGF